MFLFPNSIIRLYWFVVIEENEKEVAVSDFRIIETVTLKSSGSTYMHWTFTFIMELCNKNIKFRYITYILS